MPGPRWNADRIYEELRQHIIEFQLAPGTRVTEGEFCTRYGVSRTPVRAALQRLAVEGYLTIRPKQGCFIRPIDIRELAHYYDVRTSLEVTAIEMAARHMPRAALEQLAAAWDPVTQPQGRTVSEALKAAEEAFHLRLAEASGNPILVGYLRDINDHIRIIRRFGWPDDQSVTDTYRDHHRLCVLLLEGAVAEARSLMIRHIQDSQERARRVTLAQLAGLDTGNSRNPMTYPAATVPQEPEQ